MVNIPNSRDSAWSEMDPKSRMMCIAKEFTSGPASGRKRLCFPCARADNARRQA